MPDGVDIDYAALAAGLACGSIVAAAGCGKTEQIGEATRLAKRRRLILTHTHAGVDVLRARMKKLNVPSANFHIDTIAGWCLRYAVSFPKISKVKISVPATDGEWKSVYEGAARVIEAGSVTRVLHASYEGLYVDEYQDCNALQHRVTTAIAKYLPVCLFGDPLQAIFDFKGQSPVDFDREVFPNFARAGEMTKPWRWHQYGNDELATWLAGMRIGLEQRNELDLTKLPAGVNWVKLPADAKYQAAAVVGEAKRLLADGERLIVIADAKKIAVRAQLSKLLSSVGFSNIEPIDCKPLFKFAKAFEATAAHGRLDLLMAFIVSCMTGVGATNFKSAIVSLREGKKKHRKKYGELIDIAEAICQGDDGYVYPLALLEGFHERIATDTFRREMFYALRSAVRAKVAKPTLPLTDAIRDVQAKVRHIGRHIGYRAVGSTLLVKGLEFDRAVVVGTPEMSKKDWYVALTRATKGMTILSPAQQIRF
jgi:DNA helicase-2/ATP-dependent DNA helicase PcrA